jgi:hypothetical protein
MSDTLTYRLPNGGRYWHLLRGDSRTALCGYTPASPTGTRMHPRGYWATLPQAAHGGQTCPRCQRERDKTARGEEAPP